MILLFAFNDRQAEAKLLAEAVNLRCEYLINPLGLDVARPRLSWQLADERRGARQTAYRIMVSNEAQLLLKGKADVWDSGKISSDQSVQVPYGGAPLESRRRYYWTVQVWDKDGKPSRFSDPAWWETGMLQASDWRAQWISLSNSKMAADLLTDVKWISFPEADARVDSSVHDKNQNRSHTSTTTRYFRTAFDLPADKAIASAVLYVSADNSFAASLNGYRVGAISSWDRRFFNAMRVDGRASPGRNVLAISATSDRQPAALAALLHITYSDGSTERISSNSNWKVAAGSNDKWTMPEFVDTGWQAAAVISEMAPPALLIDDSSPLLRKTFKLTKPVKSARIYVTAFGSYRLHINGQRVGNDILTPDWTDYRKRISYQTYDVTGLLKPGANAVGAILGSGWYASGLGWNLQRYNFGPPPIRLLMQMHIKYADNSEEVVATDNSWKGARGPILRSEIYAGEIYDARLEQSGWDMPDFNDTQWSTVGVTENVAVVLSAQRSPTIKITQTVKPKAITTPANGVLIYDMGQNMVGWTRLKVRGTAGTRISLRFAERLHSDGTILRENLRSAEATDTYILKGEGDEIFEPHFTYHGFRYVEVTGFPGNPNLDTLTGQVLHTAAAMSGQFSTSNEMVNQLWRNITWGQRSNLHSVPTDCPQRDERLGWMGDAQIFWRTASYNMDMAAFSHKWVQDVVEAQSPEGGFSDVSPRVIDLRDGAPAWGDAGIIVPWTAYRHYGDTRIIEDHWAAMEKWINYIQSVNPDFLWIKRRNNDFGDWVPAGSTTPKDLIGTAYWAYDARLMAEMARALGREADAKRYDEMFEHVRAAFIKAFVKDNGEVGNGSQTCYALALHIGLLPPDKRSSAVDHLVHDIETRGGHLSTGFIGTAYLMPVLSENGHNDVAYRLLLNDTYPSWLYMVKQGATTMWERWNSDTSTEWGMNSYNHFAFGVVGEWLYRYVAGIDTDEHAPGFRRIIIRPRPDSRLAETRADYDSQYGRITSAWKMKSKEGFFLDVTVPANTTATIYVPMRDQRQVTESGKPIESVADIKFLRMDQGAAV